MEENTNQETTSIIVVRSVVGEVMGLFIIALGALAHDMETNCFSSFEDSRLKKPT